MAAHHRAAFGLAIVAPAGKVGRLGKMADQLDDSRFEYAQWTSASSGPLGDAGFSPSIGSCSVVLTRASRGSSKAGRRQGNDGQGIGAGVEDTGQLGAGWRISYLHW